MSKQDATATLSYEPAVDGLRAVAVISVVLFHLHAGLLPGGYAGVDVFFVISGFVVTGSLLGMRFERLRDLLVYFYARRIVRIMPALVVMLLVTTLAYCLFVPDAWLSRSIDGVAKAAFFGLSNNTLALQNDEYFSPRAAFNPFIHTWSLGVEEQFYFIFPFLMYWHLRRARGENATVWLLAALTLASLLTCALLSKYQWRYAFYTIPSRFWELGIGMGLCLTIGWWRPALKRAGAAVRHGLAAVSVLLIGMAFVIPESPLFPFPLAILPVLGAAGLIASVCTRGVLTPLLASAPAVAIGRRSYSLYLWHWPVFVLFRWTLGLDTLTTALLAVALMVVLGEISYRWVEQPTRHHRIVKAWPRGWVVAGGLVAIGASAMASYTMLWQKPHLSLSQTTDTDVWYPDGRKKLPAGGMHCQLGQDVKPVASGTVTRYTPSGCRDTQPSQRLFVIGDSHNLAYTPMLRRYAASSGTEVQTFFLSGCPYLSLQEPMSDRRACSAYFKEASEDLAADLRPGDVLFLPSLRLKRYQDQDGGSHEATPSAEVELARRRDALAEAEHMLRQLASTGARIVFEAPKPLYRAPLFRCSDWFNKDNPACQAGFTIPATELQALRSPVLAAMTQLRERVPGVEVWDPFPVLCPGTVCSARSARGPLYFDGDHLSGHGNDALYQSFAAFIGAHAKPRLMAQYTR